MTTIDLSSDINFTSSNETSWPVTFTNTTGSNKTVFITNNLLLTATNQYFIMGSDNITIDGQK